MPSSDPRALTLRLATHADLPSLGGLAAELVAMHHVVDPSRFFLPDRVEEGYVAWFGRELGRAEAVVIVAELEGRVLGYAYGTLETRDFNSLLDAHGAIHDIFVADDARRSGAGLALMKRMLAELEARGAPRVVLTTMVGNERAQRLFRRCGFRPTMLEMTRDRGGPQSADA